MESGEVLRVMQCHSTTDERPGICVGFARRLPDTVGVRLARILGVFDPDALDHEDPPLRDLHTLPSLLLVHGGTGGGRCPTRCPGCLSSRCSSESADDPL